MKDDGLGDWRVQAATKLAKNLPAAYSGGPSHEVGSPVYYTTLTKDSKGNYIGFITPSPPALALSIAANGAKRAKGLRESLALKHAVTPYGSGWSVANENIVHLFDYFEQCMVTVTFSFQALETFCNDVIANNLSGTFELQRSNKLLHVSSDELQKLASTEEKLASVVPTILGLESPKGNKVWQRFKELKDVRDSTIHLKSSETYSQGNIDHESLFYQFFRLKVEEFPRVALEMISCFIKPEQPPRWFELARDQVSY